MKAINSFLLAAIFVFGLRQATLAQTAPRQENLTSLAVGVLYSYEGGGSIGVPDKTVVQVFNMDGTLVVEGNTQGSGRRFLSEPTLSTLTFHLGREPSSAL